MTRLATTVVVGAMLATAAPAHATPTPQERLQRVRYRSLEYPPDSFSVHENVLTVHAAAVRFGLPESRLRCIVNRESRWNEYAYNSSSGASGLFQHLRTYWFGRVAAYRSWAPERLQIKSGASPFSARANVLVSARMLAQGGWSHWGSSC